MIRLAVVSDATQLQQDIPKQLEKFGYRATVVAQPDELFTFNPADRYDLVLIALKRDAGEEYRLASRIREISSIGVIVLCADGASVDERVKGFKSGADLVLVPPLEACELAAAGDNLARRLDRREISAAVPIRRESENWKLDRIAWELVAPGGKAIHLTAGEFRFISCLVETPGLPVTRSAIAAALGHDHRTYDPRRLDAVVRRLRRKAEALVGSVLPLRAAHASGYVFTAAVTVI